MDKLKEVLSRLNTLEGTTKSGSNFSRLTEIASFMDDLSDIVSTLEQAQIDWEDERVELNIKA